VHSGERLVEACVELVGVTGAGIMLMSGEVHRGTFGSSDQAISLVEDLQFTLGEGPCMDTYRSGEPVFEPQLADPAVDRWPEFAGPAVAAGVEAIFGFPLLAGANSIGALDLYIDRPGDLSVEQLTDARVMAEVVTHTVLELQAGVGPGGLAEELEAVAAVRAIVHQASGMVSQQLGIRVGDALSLLRARAYADGSAIDAVAHDIVARRLRLEY
jgi:hypothetical protein